MSDNPSCCGETRESNYCPICGKQLIVDPLAEIATHFRTQLGTLKTRLATAVHSKNADSSNSNWWSNKEKRLRKSLEKYEAWAKAVESALKRKAKT